MRIIDGKKYYGIWAGDPKGRMERETDCVEEVYYSSGFWRWYQCSRKRGHGLDGLYCKQHAKKHEVKDGRKSD